LRDRSSIPIVRILGFLREPKTCLPTLHPRFSATWQ
jgi:hypothetical protein